MSERMKKEWIEVLFLRFRTIYQKKWLENFTKAEIDIAMEEWAEALGGYDGQSIKGALDYCRSNIEWPPSIAQFRKLCDKFSGIPDMEQAFTAAIRRDFYHPIIKLAYGAIGSWAFTHSDEKGLRDKFKGAYDDARDEYSRDRAFYDKDLLDYQEEQKRIESESQKAGDQTKRIGEYYIDEIRNKLGKPSKYLTDEERQNIKNIVGKGLSTAKDQSPIDYSSYYDQMRKERAEEGMRIYNHNQARRTVESENQDKASHKPSSSYKGWMAEGPVKVRDYFGD